MERTAQGGDAQFGHDSATREAAVSARSSSCLGMPPRVDRMCLGRVIFSRHPEARAKRASKDERPGPSPFEGRAAHGHLRVTDHVEFGSDRHTHSSAHFTNVRETSPRRAAARAGAIARAFSGKVESGLPPEMLSSLKIS